MGVSVGVRLTIVVVEFFYDIQIQATGTAAAPPQMKHSLINTHGEIIMNFKGHCKRDEASLQALTVQ